MIGSRLRPIFAHVFEPIARTLLRVGLSPDHVTIIGTVFVVTTALVLYPRGNLLAATSIIMLFVLTDSLDGTMARLSGRSSAWGAFLDSSLDRVADAAIFGGLLLWFVSEDDTWGVVLSLAALVLGQLVSYVRARAEGLGAQAAVGVAERVERLVIVLVAAFLVGLGLPSWILTAAMGLLALLSAVTVLQRFVVVHQQLRGVLAPSAPAKPVKSEG